MKSWLQKIELKKNGIRLVPLQPEHGKHLLWATKENGLDELWYTKIPTEHTMQSYIATALEEQERGASLPFAVLDVDQQQWIGSTRFCNIDAPNRRLEIGHTWYAPSYQRTRANTNCKHLLLTHAFEELNCIAVEFRTHWFNFKSRNAILRLGAKQDGVLRNHRIDSNGLLRDTVVFSIVNSEWPTVKKNLEFKLKEHQQ